MISRIMVGILGTLIGEMTLLNLLVAIIGLVILWIIVSIPVYIAGKIVTAGKSTLGEAMIATLLGPIVYALTVIVVDFFLGAIIGAGAYTWAIILALIAWVGVYKASFETGWLGAIAIAILAIIVFAVLGIFLGAFLSYFFGLTVPAPLLPRF
jgi:hypothetical protein